MPKLALVLLSLFVFSGCVPEQPTPAPEEPAAPAQPAEPILPDEAPSESEADAANGAPAAPEAAGTATAPEASAVSADALVEEWLALGEERPLPVKEAHEIGLQLAQTPQGLHPILNVIGDPDAHPMTKVLGVITTTPHVDSAMMDRLNAMTEAGNDPTTRACATHLLGEIEGDAAEQRLLELVDDPEHQVEMAATFSLAARGNEATQNRLHEVWQDESLTTADREQVLHVITEAQVEEHMTLFAPAISDATLTPTARDRLITMLGRVGDERVLPDLRRVAENDPDPNIQMMAQSAIDVIEERQQGVGDAPEASNAAPDAAE